MGVDFTGYSCVRTEPIHAKYRAKISRMSPEAQEDFTKDLLTLRRDEMALCMALNGVSRDAATGQLVFPEKIEIAEETQNAFYAEYEKNPDFLAVSWHKNKVYLKTADTKEASADRSYSGYGDFKQTLKELWKLPASAMHYLPPSTDCAPEYGIAETDQALSCLRGLNTVRAHFVAPDWVPDLVKYGMSTDHRFDEKEPCIHADSWFFKEFYCVMSVAADGGIVRIS